ncbi:MAG: hypothetical protein K2Q06_02950 [Parvularculaceae bacterium]|nr:hypothetical protein [Parvularculaceae bacterium]
MPRSEEEAQEQARRRAVAPPLDDRRAIFALVDQAREAAGLSKYRLCAEANVHPTTFMRWRDGAVAPSRRGLLRVVNVLIGRAALDADRVAEIRRRLETLSKKLGDAA